MNRREIERLPHKLCVGTVTGVDSSTGMLLSVRSSGGRTHTRIESCLNDVSVGAKVVMVKTLEHSRWVVIGQIQSGYNRGDSANNALLAPPASLIVFAAPGVIIVEWETYPGDNTLSYDVQSAPDSAGDPDLANITDELVTRGSYFIYESAAEEETVHFRVRALRWIGNNNLVYSGWSGWLEVTSETKAHDLLGERHNATVPDAAPTPGLMIVGNSSNEWQSRDLSQDISVSSLGAATVQGFQSRTVAATAPADGEAYLWSAIHSEWQPSAPPGGVHNLLSADHSDTVIGTADPGQMIVGTAANTWQRRTMSQDITVSDAGAVTVTGLQGRQVASTAPAEGQVYGWIDGQWRPTTVSGGDDGVAPTIPATTPRWHADGPLAVLDEIDGVWRMISDCRVDAVVLYLSNIGSASSTIVDIEKSINEGNAWSSLFDPADRPTLLHDDANHTTSAAPSAAEILAAGTLLRANIDQVATGARGLDVTLSLTVQEGLFRNLMPIIGIA